MALDPKFTKFSTASQILASFDSTDLQEGTGNVTYYGLTEQDSTGVGYMLMRDIIISQTPSTVRSSTGTTTVDFDLAPFNLPRYVKGTAIFRATVKIASTGTLAVQLKKWDGSSETNITDEITSQTIDTAVATIPNVVIKMPVTTETQFEAGDVLRLTVKITLIAGGTSLTLYHDPNNTTPPSASTSAALQIRVPFRIE